MSSASVPENASPAAPTGSPSPRQVLLGLFILFQLAFLLGSNLIAVVTQGPPYAKDQVRVHINQVLPGFPDKQGHGWTWADRLETDLKRWAQLTGQDQEWTLFAPYVYDTTGFPAVLLSWEEPTKEEHGLPGGLFAFDPKNGLHVYADWNPAPTPQPSLKLVCPLGLLAASNPWGLVALHAVYQKEMSPAPRIEFLLSENEPEDLHDFMRIGKCRLRRYEGQFYLSPQPAEDEKTRDEAARGLTVRMKNFLRDTHPALLAYLQWRLKAWQREHPDQPAPRQVCLCERFYRIHGPEEPRGWDGPLLVPCVRWQPSAPRKQNEPLLESYDFTVQRFGP